MKKRTKKHRLTQEPALGKQMAAQKRPQKPFHPTDSGFRMRF